MNWSLGAIHQEKKGLKISLVSAAAYILLCLFLIPLFREGGLAIASLASCVVTFVISYTYIRKYLWEKILMKGSYIKIILVSLLMGLCIYPFINRSIFISIPVGIAAYFILILLFRVISTEDILKNINIMLGKSKLIEPQNE
jgi:O-antigen/teichoic acid export membrane protein